MSLNADEQRAIATAATLAAAYRDGLGTAPAVPEVRPEAMVGRFGEGVPDTGALADAVIREVVETATPGLHSHASPRFFGYVCGGSMPAGVAADMLVSAWGQNSASSWESPAVAEIEQVMCRWCLDLLDLPRDSGVGVVTGATVANTQAIMAARHALLDSEGWDVEERGMFGAPEVPVLIGADCHSAPLAGLRYAGFGAARAIRVETDDQGRIRPEAFEAALKGCAAPPLVILQAGQINTGAFDPFAEIIPMVRERGGWTHVDGAFGLWLRAVPDLRNRLAGVEEADSWAVDLHKWLSAPYDAGLCITRDRGPLVAAMTARGAYLPDPSNTWEPSDSTLELSRRARGVPSYVILKHLGRAGVQELVARHCRLAKRAADRLSQDPGIEVLNEVSANQISLSCGSDALTAAVLARVHDRGKVYPSHGAWRGRQIIRISIINYATTETDVDLLCDEILSARRALA
ncbi:pyridoxal-dependent decarboxylase [uncultured Mameliella sp.]|uniref:pyridoxal phosphate-dependent decarboxylase family protein n=1 Tax=uncultured Mameliella sp. TaxID=1447087 RepID=UPI002629598A|nr:pyridoxal-dependent decarboxylase [uncultured Mameliella sp.]